MRRAFPARTALRAATHEAHQRVDSVFSAFDLAKREQYGRFLQAQAAAHIPLEATLDSSGARDVLPDWALRRRGHLIRVDLCALGISEPDYATAPPLDGEAGVLGAIYVLEGARLGGAVLSKSIPEAFPSAYLAPAAPGLWRGLLDVLEARLSTPVAQVTAIQAARSAFELFERSGRQYAEALNE